MKRYYRNDDDSIYDRKTGETINPVIEDRWPHDHYVIKDWEREYHIYHDDIEEKK